MAQLMPMPLTVSCFSKIQIGFTFLVPAHPGSPGQRAVKWVCVCVWILDLCNDIVKKGCIPEDWNSNVVLTIYKGNGDPIQCGSYRAIKLLEHAMKVVERISEHRIWQQIEVDRQTDRSVT